MSEVRPDPNLDELVRELGSTAFDEVVEDDGWFGTVGRTRRTYARDVARTELARLGASALTRLAVAYAALPPEGREEARRLFHEAEPQTWARIPSETRLAIVGALRAAAEPPPPDAESTLACAEGCLNAHRMQLAVADEADGPLIDGVVSALRSGEHVADAWQNATHVRDRAALAAAVVETLLDPDVAPAPCVWVPSGVLTDLSSEVLARMAAFLARAPEGRVHVLLQVLKGYVKSGRLSEADRAAVVERFAHVCMESTNEGTYRDALAACGSDAMGRALTPLVAAALDGPDEERHVRILEMCVIFARGLSTLLERFLALTAAGRARRVRYVAMRVIGEMGPPAAPVVAELTRALADPWLAAEAAFALGKIGAAAASALPALGRAHASAYGNQRLEIASRSALEDITRASVPR